jgi:hypothetical protein
MTTDTPAQCVLLVDEGSGLIAPRDPAAPPEGGEAFFTEDGQLSPTLAQIVSFFQTRVTAEAQTRAAMAALAAAGLLTPTPPVPDLPLPNGVLWVDSAALTGLGRSELAKLHRLGALGLAARESGDYELAQRSLELALESFARLDQPSLRLHTLGNLSTLALYQGDPARALELGVYVIGFSFPVVPRGQARIRTQMSAAHTFEQIDRTVAAFTQAGRELGVI